MKQMYIFPALASVYAKLSTLQGTDAGQGANLIGVQDAGSKFVGDTVEEVLLEIADGTTLDGRYVKKNSELDLNVKTVTDTYQILVTDYTIVCDKLTDFTVTLPVGVVGQILNIKNINTGVVTIEGSGTETIDGELNQSIIQWENITLQCYELTKWIILK